MHMSTARVRSIRCCKQAYKQADDDNSLAAFYLGFPMNGVKSVEDEFSREFKGKGVGPLVRTMGRNPTPKEDCQQF